MPPRFLTCECSLSLTRHPFYLIFRSDSVFFWHSGVIKVFFWCSGATQFSLCWRRSLATSPSSMFSTMVSCLLRPGGASGSNHHNPVIWSFFNRVLIIIETSSNKGRFQNLALQGGRGVCHMPIFVGGFGTVYRGPQFGPQILGSPNHNHGHE